MSKTKNNAETQRALRYAESAGMLVGTSFGRGAHPFEAQGEAVLGPYSFPQP
jgi:hypothetical protein